MKFRVTLERDEDLASWLLSARLFLDVCRKAGPKLKLSPNIQRGYRSELGRRGDRYGIRDCKLPGREIDKTAEWLNFRC